MKYIDGRTFSLTPSGEVLDFLKSRKLDEFQLKPSSLNIGSDRNYLILQFTNGKLHQYPVRRSFLYKLLGWYKFPVSQLEKLSIESVVSICNDFLLNIKREYVNVKLENNEVLTVTSPEYIDINDSEIIEKFCQKGIRAVSRDDFVTRIYFNEKYRIEPFPGDIFGFGYNILNSETGFHSLNFKHFLYRYTCSNGAFIAENMGNNFLYHYKNSKEKLMKLINDNIKTIEKTKELVCLLLKKAEKVKVSGDFDLIKKQIRRIIGYKDSEVFLKSFNSDSYKYQLFNHITSKAKSYDIQKQIKLETIAGNLLMN